MKTIGFGTRQIGGPPSYSPLEEKKAKEILSYSFEKGIRVYDTAPIYGLGKSEVLLGETFKDIRKEVKIITKFGILWDARKQTYLECTRESMKRELDTSLKRLQTDYIDMYLLHIPNPTLHIEEIIKQLNIFKNEGIIKSYGLCNTYGNQLKKFLENPESQIAYIEDFYNIIERKAENLIFPYIGSSQKFIAYSPLFRGVLTQKNIGDLLKRNEDGINRLLKNQSLPEIIKKKKIYEHIAKIKGIPIEKLALNFLKNRNQVDTILFGTTNKEHLDFFLSLTED